MKNELRDVIIIIIIALLLGLAIFKVVPIAIAKSEAHECAKLEEYSKTLKDFYYTDYQIEQCHPTHIPNTNVVYRNDYQKFNK